MITDPGITEYDDGSYSWTYELDDAVYVAVGQSRRHQLMIDGRIICAIHEMPEMNAWELSELSIGETEVDPHDPIEAAMWRAVEAYLRGSREFEKQRAIASDDATPVGDPWAEHRLPVSAFL